MRLPRSVVATLLLFPIAAATARGQTELWTAYDTDYADQLAVIGDVNGDGVRDLEAGAPFFSNHGRDRGLIRIYDGRTGVELRSRAGLATRAYLGHRVAALGADVDGDGVEDLLAQQLGPDRTFVLSGADLKVVTAVDRSGVLGSVSDLDHDGLRDFALGPDSAPFSVRFFSSKTGALLRVIPPVVPGHRDFGQWFGELGDVDHDGAPDFVVADASSPAAGSGRVHVMSLRSGHALATLVPPAAGGFGYGVGVIDDLDGDGIRDFYVCAPNETVGPHRNVGVVRIYSGATALEIGRIDGSTREPAHHCISVGDFDGDGMRDLAVGDFDGQVGVPDGNPVFVRSGRTLAKFTEIRDEVGSPTRLTLGGDLDGDGFDELVSCYPYSFGYRGKIAVHRGGPRFLAPVPEVREEFLGYSRGYSDPSGSSPLPTKVDGAGDLDVTLVISGFAPSRLVTVMLVSDGGVAVQQPILFGVADLLGDWQPTFPWIPIDDALYEVQAVGFDLAGNVVTTPIETIQYIFE